jgi:NAD(P)-dependent dehydrogenase (short-subunit alcohol dehydrogenase family)
MPWYSYCAPLIKTRMKSAAPSCEKVCVVTGGNRGIGKEVAGGLMGAGEHVILACRSMQSCGEAKRDLDSRCLLAAWAVSSRHPEHKTHASLFS